MTFKYEVGDLLQTNEKAYLSCPKSLLVLRQDPADEKYLAGYYCLDPVKEEYYDLSTVHVHRNYRKVE